MSKLFYNIPIEEEYNRFGDRAGNYQLCTKNLPHIKQIKDWLPKLWNESEIHKTFDGILEGKVQSTSMKIIQKKDGSAVARVTIEFVPGFRLSEKRRMACWDQMDAQMSDGFGECVDMHQIPNAPEGWTLYI